MEPVKMGGARNKSTSRPSAVIYHMTPPTRVYSIAIIYTSQTHGNCKVCDEEEKCNEEENATPKNGGNKCPDGRTVVPPSHSINKMFIPTAPSQQITTAPTSAISSSLVPQRPLMIPWSAGHSRLYSHSTSACSCSCPSH